jgi:hypothetical protein
MFFNATANIWFYLRGVHLRRLRTQKFERGRPRLKLKQKRASSVELKGIMIASPISRELLGIGTRWFHRIATVMLRMGPRPCWFHRTLPRQLSHDPPR